MAEVDEFLAEFPSEMQVISQKLRAIIKNTVPTATEKVYYGWRGVGYRHPKAGYFGCIFPFAEKVRFAFEHGVLIPDPDNLLQRPPVSSKQVRYLEFQKESDIQEDQLVAFLHTAIRAKS